MNDLKSAIMKKLIVVAKGENNEGFALINSEVKFSPEFFEKIQKDNALIDKTILTFGESIGIWLNKWGNSLPPRARVELIELCKSYATQEKG